MGKAELYGFENIKTANSVKKSIERYIRFKKNMQNPQTKRENMLKTEN